MHTHPGTAAPCAAAFPFAVASNDDAATHDLFSAVAALACIYQLPAPAVFRIINAIERAPQALEDMRVGDVLALVAQQGGNADRFQQIAGQPETPNGENA